ncbi:ATP-grasp domain-containing protein [Azospirillum sp. TSO22-1]|uniref:ATP-grasp domain-containing protein n=1 Tax=Azospirillum sp. TSO22-1 TaxID=716789 RepID=UPI000D607FDC|nr:ATP-grasp domain-containing protein [Azospirillum sp. TSO22-1]PWC35358.1 hypothetical protein TSO221_29800 [Azospirillum sp. TSO22-1]
MTPPARSPDKGEPDVVVVAVSARALAAAACRAGRRPAAIDLFADDDTQQLAAACLRLPSGGLRLDGDALMEALERPELRGLPLVYGAGFEDDPRRLERIAGTRLVLGNGAVQVALVKDPFAFAEALDRLGIPHPEAARALPGSPERYLLKRIGGSGGGHVAAVPPATRPGAEASRGWYFQRRVGGHAVSVLALGDGQRAVVVGFSRQWPAPTPEQPFRYGGAAGPMRATRRLGGLLSDMTTRLCAAFGLVGLVSADFLVAGETVHLLEINPRPGATLDVFDRAPLPPLFGLHVDACAGRLPDSLPTPWRCRAALVHYAAQPVTVGRCFPWPAWVADRPAGPARLDAGAPVCTVQAEGASVGSARRQAEQRQRQLAAQLESQAMEIQA